MVEVWINLVAMEQCNRRAGKEPIIDLNVGNDGSNSDSDGGMNTAGKNNNEYNFRHNHNGQNLYPPLNKRLNEVTTDEVFSMTFNNIDKAKSFYNSYAKVVGFSVRKDDLSKDKDGIIVSRSWVCSKEGIRLQKHLQRPDRQCEAKSITRCGCLAVFRIAYKQKLNVWVVKKFNAEHNHELVPISEVQFLRSHRP
ncbi:hypothetical protein L1049_007741 [Liquidambar formosana]|uniref:FAR1 domain-containing protein n=1 Tax=Liquidambar formosana TaxID=63359 RepID=A0AAP0X8M9_LIQFO